MASEFVHKHFDKILLVTLFLFMLFFTLTTVIVGGQLQQKVDPNTVAWCRETAGIILGALIGLITARATAVTSVETKPKPGNVGESLP